MTPDQYAQFLIAKAQATPRPADELAAIRAAKADVADWDAAALRRYQDLQVLEAESGLTQDEAREYYDLQLRQELYLESLG